MRKSIEPRRLPGFGGDPRSNAHSGNTTDRRATVNWSVGCVDGWIRKSKSRTFCRCLSKKQSRNVVQSIICDFIFLKDKLLKDLFHLFIWPIIEQSKVE